MKKFYFYIYFRIFVWNHFLWKNKKMAAFNSSLAISLSFYSFFMTIVLIMERTIGSSIYNQENYWYFVFGIALIVFFNHYVFEVSGKFWNMENEFSRNKNIDWYLRGVAIWTFLLGSNFAFILLRA